MFKSEVTVLKEENTKQVEMLGKDSTSVINKIMKSMSIFKVNSYDSQVIHRDLIGMAQEFELRGSTFERSIGNDIEGFTNEIINNSIGPSKIEILLGFLIKFFSIFSLSFLFLSVFAYTSLTWDANPIILIYFIAVPILSFVTDIILTPLYSVKKGFKKRVPIIFTIFSFLLLGATVYLLNDNENTIKIHGGLMIVTSGLAYMIVSYLNVKNIKKLSQGKMNHIADLL